MRSAVAALALLSAGCVAAPPAGAAVVHEPSLSRNALAAAQHSTFREVLCATLAETAPQAGPCEAFLWRDKTEPARALDVLALGPLRHRWRIVMVSGYGSDCFAPWVRMYGDARARLAEIGVTVTDAPVAGLSGTAWNAAIVAETVLGLGDDPSAKTMLLGYSKGAADILEALGSYPAAAARVDAVLSISGSLGGAQLAETAPAALDFLIDHAPGTACGPHDDRALWSLRPDVRAFRLRSNPRPPEPPLFVLASFVERDRVSTGLLAGWTELSRRGADTDGQLTVDEQVTDGAVLLGHPRADHWAVALPIETAASTLSAVLVDRNTYPRAPLIESAIRFVDQAQKNDGFWLGNGSA